MQVMYESNHVCWVSVFLFIFFTSFVLYVLRMYVLHVHIDAFVYVLNLNVFVYVVNIGFSVIVRIVFNFSLLLCFIKMCLSVWLFAYACVYMCVCIFLNPIHLAIHVNDAAALVSAFAFINFRLVKSEKKEKKREEFLNDIHTWFCLLQ